MKIKSLLKKVNYCLIILLLHLPLVTLGQDPDDPGDDPDAPAAPIDGGVTILLAAGMLYGATKLKEKKEK